MEIFNSVFNTFIDLIKFDQESVKLISKIEVIKKGIEARQNEKTELSNSLESSRRHLKEFEKDVHNQDLRLKEINQKESEKKAILADVASNNKEYQAVKREIESIKRLQHGYENELVSSWNKFDVLKKEFAEQEDKINEKVQNLESLILVDKKELSSLEKALNDRQSERAAKEKGIPEEWLARYNIMSHQVADPVVPVEGQSCSACFTELPRQDFISLQKNKMLQCKGCFRLLYRPE